MTLAVVIPQGPGRESSIGRVLEALRGQLTQVAYDTDGKLGAAAARNYGARLLLDSGQEFERVMFLDADCVPSPAVFEEHATARTDVVFSLRRHSTPECREPRYMPTMERLCRRRDRAIHRYAWSCCVSYPLAMFRELGGFDEAYGSRYEDIDLARRAWAIGATFAVGRHLVLHIDHGRLASWSENQERSRKMYDDGEEAYRVRSQNEGRASGARS